MAKVSYFIPGMAKDFFGELKNGEILVSINLWTAIIKTVKNDKREKRKTSKNYGLQLSAYY
jgi:hypothetical protein